MHFDGIESSKNVMKDLTIKKNYKRSHFEYGLIFGSLIISNFFIKCFELILF